MSSGRSPRSHSPRPRTTGGGRGASTNSGAWPRTTCSPPTSRAPPPTLPPPPAPSPAPPEGAPPLSESLRAALEKRNELHAQGAVIREGEAAVSAARTEFAPTFFGQGGYSYETNELNPHKSVFSILLGGKVNLFSGFADEASLRQARLTVDRRKETLRNTAGGDA